MSEANLWQLVKRNLSGPGHHLQRIEDAYQEAIPDLEYCILGASGWIELKFKNEGPKRESTVLRVDHYTPEQRLWHRNRAACGGRVWVFIRVAEEFFLFRGAHAAKHLGIDWTLQDCRDRAIGHWRGRVDWNELRDLITE